MLALYALHNRNSVSLLCEPAPSKEQLNNILQAGARACDHRLLRPWQFLVIEGDARLELGELMLQVKLLDEPELGVQSQQKLREKPLRAPLIIAVIAKIQHDDKVPEVEQILSAGAAAQMMVTAAFAQNIGAIWRSGALSHDKRLCMALGLQERDCIVGFLYMGSVKTSKPLSDVNALDYTSYWTDTESNKS